MGSMCRGCEQLQATIAALEASSPGSKQLEEARKRLTVHMLVKHMASMAEAAVQAGYIHPDIAQAVLNTHRDQLMRELGL